jgi:hypothetical protein
MLIKRLLRFGRYWKKHSVFLSILSPHRRLLATSLPLILWGTALAGGLSEHPTIKQLHYKSNIIRKESRLAEHKLSAVLTAAAQDHAWYMARQHDKNQEDFNHRGGNGSPGQRAARAGYYGLVMENIARGYPSVDKTFTAWLDSGDHRAAILAANTSDAGFGYARARDGTTYWVGLYGAPQCQEQPRCRNLPSPSLDVPIPLSSPVSWWVSNP